MTLTPQTIADVISSTAIPDAEKSKTLAAIFDAAASNEVRDGYKEILLGERKKLAQDIIRATDTGAFAEMTRLLEGISAQVETGMPDKATVTGMFDGIGGILKSNDTVIDRLAAENGRLAKTFEILATAEKASKTFGGPAAEDTQKTAMDLAAQGARIASMKAANSHQKAAIGRLRETYEAPR